MAQVEIIAANLNSKKENSVINNLKKVCAYARVSTDSEEQLTSYSSQIKYYSDKISPIQIGNLLVYMLMRVLVVQVLKNVLNLKR